MALYSSCSDLRQIKSFLTVTVPKDPSMEKPRLSDSNLVWINFLYSDLLGGDSMTDIQIKKWQTSKIQNNDLLKTQLTVLWVGGVSGALAQRLATAESQREAEMLHSSQCTMGCPVQIVTRKKTATQNNVHWCWKVRWTIPSRGPQLT